MAVLNPGGALQKLVSAKRSADVTATSVLSAVKAKILVLVATVSSSALVTKTVAAYRTAASSTIASLLLQASASTFAILGPLWRLSERLALWLVGQRSAVMRTDARSTLWVVGGHGTMTNVCDKRTTEELTFTIDCTSLLDAGETILSVAGITADEGDLVLSSAAKNTLPVITKDGRTIAAGKALQVQISGGVIPAGRPWQMCYVRPQFSTTLDGSATYNPKREATVVLRLIDNPPT
ncbi:MAG TPA: hypothetical protein VIP10_12525 [Burkholderiaceae bacterium]